ncbi:hypothetical protein [Burkholderia sp. BCC1988]|uniref:hypothetical protein n=1 Tax=Burkholderia sp. BCC1988 TaxID=2817443 RepID=UPI002AB11BA7|nr:hypothetical protein [Burkholderia sp. BCC1988]
MTQSNLPMNLYAFIYDVEARPEHPDPAVRNAPFVRIRAFAFGDDPYEVQRRLAADLNAEHWKVLNVVEAQEIEESTVTEPGDLALVETARRHGTALGVCAPHFRSGGVH